MHFEKYNGQGNDFVVVEVETPEAMSASQAIQVCDRHFGVGADGVLLISPARDALARMTVLNADGSRPEMCGNGLRCVARFLADHRHAPAQFQVETDAGMRRCEVSARGDQTWVSISLGAGQPQGCFEMQWGGADLEFDLVSMGNPHAVLFDSRFDVDQIDLLGPLVSSAQTNGANVEFVRQLGPDTLEVIVWERGVGRTLACGTGAGAVVVAAARRGLVPYGSGVHVRLPGGPLEVCVQNESLLVEKQGPVNHVFSGELGASLSHGRSG